MCACPFLVLASRVLSFKTFAFMQLYVHMDVFIFIYLWA